MRFATVASLVSVAWLNGVHSQLCDMELFSIDSVTPSTGNEIARIPINDEMTWSFDVTINSFPTGWASVFHCGSTDAIRIPGVWLHPDSDNSGATHEGFHISASQVANGNPWINPGPELAAGNTYHVEMALTQTSFVVTIDGVVQYNNEAYAAHNTYAEQPCYAGDPWYPAADVTLSNVVISTPATDESYCRDCSILAIDNFLLHCSDEFASQNGEIDGLNTQLSDLETRVTATESGVQTNADDIAQLQSAGNALEARVAQNEVDIAALQTELDSTVASQIAALQEDVAAVNARVDLFATFSAESAPVGVVDGTSNASWNLNDISLKDAVIFGLLALNLVMACRNCSGSAGRKNARNGRVVKGYANVPVDSEDVDDPEAEQLKQ